MRAAATSSWKRASVVSHFPRSLDFPVFIRGSQTRLPKDRQRADNGEGLFLGPSTIKY